MSTAISDAEKGLGGKAEAAVREARPAPKKSMADAYKKQRDWCLKQRDWCLKQRDWYLKRFWKYCEDHRIGLTEQDFSNTVEEKASSKVARPTPNNIRTSHSGLFLLQRIDLEDICRLGAPFHIDPGFFAHHVKARCADVIHVPMVVTDSYWSMTCRYEEGLQEDLKRPVQVSFTTLADKYSTCRGAAYFCYTCLRCIVLLLIDDAHRALPGDILPILARYEMDLDDRDHANHLGKLFAFPPANAILQRMVRFNASKSTAESSFEVLMRLTSLHLGLNDLAAISRELDSDATIKPSKTVLRRLNRCRSLVLRALNGVITLRAEIKASRPSIYEILYKSMMVVKDEHPSFDWIPFAAGDRLESDVSIFLRILNRLEPQAEKQLTQLRETFQTLTTAIAIEDSEFNKKQAQRSTMLTLLAAIYLPLTLATGIFGMNIQEINGGAPRWWFVVVVTAILFVPSIAFTSLLFAGDGAHIKRKLWLNRDRNGTSESRDRAD
jgi:hypothetical protein